MHVPILLDLPSPWYVHYWCLLFWSNQLEVTGLLQTLDDCGSPPLAARAPTLAKPSSLRTSDHKSMMAYTGLPLDIFGKVVIILFSGFVYL